MTACGEAPSGPPPDVNRLAKDLHFTIGERQFTLPFVALADYAYQGMSFSLDRSGDRERAEEAADKLLEEAGSADAPLNLHNVTVLVRTYGWNDADMRQREMCPLLTQDWSRSVCDNPWAALQQALPGSRFELFDISWAVQGEDAGWFDCVAEEDPIKSIPQELGRSAFICRYDVYSETGRTFYRAMVRIEGDLGVLWTVDGSTYYGETPQVRADREGEALASFVRNALENGGNFPQLHQDMCRLRRPESADNPKGPDCPGPRPEISP